MGNRELEMGLLCSRAPFLELFVPLKLKSSRLAVRIIIMKEFNPGNPVPTCNVELLKLSFYPPKPDLKYDQVVSLIVSQDMQAEI